MAWWSLAMEYFIPASLRENSEQLRRAQLVAGIAMLGLVFGSGYAIFYLIIGHYWGAAIIVVCTILMCSVPFLMRASRRVDLAGNLVVLIWMIGFTALTSIEGGIHGHSVAWLACGIPLLALLIARRFTALIWCGVCFGITLFFCALDVADINPALAYPEIWRPAVTAAGYIGLAVFMSLMGFLFENSRKRAFQMMQAATTARMRVETEKKAAEDASRSKDQFLAVLSHELRTPLTPVLAAVSEIGAQEETPSEIQSDLEMIRRNVEMESKLIDDLLDVTRISSGKIILNIKVVDAHSSLRSALAICQNEIEAKDLQVSMKLEAVEHHVRADPVRLRQAFWNLIRNAVKFTPAKGRISFRSSNEAARLRIEITDTGIGIEPEAMPRIFEAFEQGGQTKTRRYGGLGLGLSIAKGIVAMHYGKLSAFSKGKNQGATFTVEVPTILPATEAPHPIILPSKPEPREMRPVNILLVEDDRDTREILTRLLQRSGYEVATADSVQKSMELAATQKFDLIVSDLGLPDGSGLDLMRQVKALCGIPGIALSGYGTEEDIRKSRAVGFARHLVKPVDTKQLQAAISELAK